MASKLSDSYEKLVLAGAILIALALGALAFLGGGKIEAAFVEPSVSQRPAPPLPGKARMDSAGEGLGRPTTLLPAKVAGDRAIDTFVGIPWFIKKDETTVDLGNPDEAPVHPPIPNAWWLGHNLNPGFADSPQQDADNDGFSNLEEFEAETNPASASDHPPLINKLQVAALIDDRFLLDYSSTTGDLHKFLFRTKMNGRVLESKTKEYIPAGKGDASVFFAQQPAQFRFQLKAIELRRVRLGGAGGEKDENFAIIEELKPNLKGRVYEVPYTGRGLEFSDYKVVFTLAAVGEGGKEFEVPENTSFSLPFDEAAKEKPFLFKEVSPEGEVVVEWQEGGETKTRTLPVPKP